jgi:hypothetical protein
LTLAQNTYKPLPWPNVFSAARRPVLLITHFFNEELLLPYWISHHAPMFDMAILIDYNSTDRSLEIIRGEAPHTWKVVSSENKDFDAIAVDLEVEKYENMYSSAWKIALNIPEFLVHPNLREALADVERSSDVQALRFRSILMTGNDSKPLQRFEPLLKQRSQYLCIVTWHGETSFSRYIHRYQYANYTPGRHAINGMVWEWFPVGFIAKFGYTPWPEIISRKLQIRSRIPLHNIERKMGLHHIINSSHMLEMKNSIHQHPQCDLRPHSALNDELKMFHRVWREVVDH